MRCARICVDFRAGKARGDGGLRTVGEGEDGVGLDGYLILSLHDCVPYI